MVWLNFLDTTFDKIFSSKIRNKIERYILLASILDLISSHNCSFRLTGEPLDKDEAHDTVVPSDMVDPLDVVVLLLVEVVELASEAPEEKRGRVRCRHAAV